MIKIRLISFGFFWVVWLIPNMIYAADGTGTEKTNPSPNPEFSEPQATSPTIDMAMPAWMENALQGKGDLNDDIIREGDMLDIHVYPQEELSVGRTVDKQGKIFFPYLGRIKVAGADLDGLEKQITQLLKQQYFENPRVLIEKQSSSIDRWLGWWKEAIVKPINVMGEVATPGTYFIPRDDVTLIEAVSIMHGFTREADLHRVYIIRKEAGGEVKYTVDAKDIIEAKKSDVPRRERATVNVIGAVGIPRPVAIYEDEGMSLMEAITANEGFTSSADVNAIRVNRIVEGKQLSFVVRGGDILLGKTPDVPLVNGDIVFVPTGGKLIHIFGEVESPGPINISLYGADKMGLIEAISLAGDFTRIAAKNSVRVIRIVEGETKVIEVKANDILKGKIKDFLLEPGDVVVVPEAFW